jgi:hypothetical protein
VRPASDARPPRDQGKVCASHVCLPPDAPHNRSSHPLCLGRPAVDLRGKGRGQACDALATRAAGPDLCHCGRGRKGGQYPIVADLSFLVDKTGAVHAWPFDPTTRWRGLPALSADGARVAVPEQCHARGEQCLAIVLLSADGKVQERVELNGRFVNEPQLRRANQLLAEGRFVPMTKLPLPFSAYDLNLMTLEVSDLVISYRGDFVVDRGGHRLATLALEPTGACEKSLWIRSLFFDDRTHTVAAEFEYNDEAGCSDPPPGWRVLRFR